MIKISDPTKKLSKTNKAIFDKILKKRKKVDMMYRLLMNHPLITKHVSDLGGYLRFKSTLADNIREFIILSISRKLNVPYEWVHHVKVAKKAKLDSKIINKIKKNDFKNFEMPYKKIIKIIDLVLKLKPIPSELKEELIDSFKIKGYIEIITLCGFYQMIAGIIIGLDVPLPKGDKKPF